MILDFSELTVIEKNNVLTIFYAVGNHQNYYCVKGENNIKLTNNEIFDGDDLIEVVVFDNIECSDSIECLEQFMYELELD